jgi:hypothetical protein
MKSNVISVETTTVGSPLTVIPTARIVRHPKSRKMKEDDLQVDPPDEETLKRLNFLAKQYPFCILHRGNQHNWLL